MTRVKICGITNVADAHCAINAGADALGFIFYKKSPRYVEPEIVAQIIEELPPFISLVGVFVNPSSSEVINIIKQSKINLLQFHGEESNDFCKQFSLPYLKAIRMKPKLDLCAEMNIFPNAKAYLLDTYTPNIYGGTGKSFNLDMIPEDLGDKIILAGGLNVDNIKNIIDKVRPYAVDVSGGVEQEKGKKNHQLLKQFFINVKQ